MNDALSISIVLPCFNEQDNLPLLVNRIHRALQPLNESYEIIFTDDCSQDNSWAVLCDLGSRDTRIRAQRFTRNCGQSAALWAGIKAARGQSIVTMDADLQMDPAEIPNFLNALKHFDCVCGTRVGKTRQGDNFVRIASSGIGNWVRNKLSHDTVTDAGCCFRAFRRECVANLKFFKGMHRFLPTLFKMENFTVTEIPITHHLRRSGKTNYGIWNRMLPGLYDVMAIRWMKKRMFHFRIAERINLDGPTGRRQPHQELIRV
jgi:glycosyltransferase involved in cell wall biosynthesis